MNAHAMAFDANDLIASATARPTALPRRARTDRARPSPDARRRRLAPTRAPPTSEPPRPTSPVGATDARANYVVGSRSATSTATAAEDIVIGAPGDHRRHPRRDRRGVHRLGRLADGERRSISRTAERQGDGVPSTATATGRAAGRGGRVRRPRRRRRSAMSSRRAGRRPRSRPHLRRVRPAHFRANQSDQPVVDYHRRGHRLDDDGRRRGWEASLFAVGSTAAASRRSSSRPRRARSSRHLFSNVTPERRRRGRSDVDAADHPTFTGIAATALAAGDLGEAPERPSRSTSRSAIRAYRVRPIRHARAAGSSCSRTSR